MKYPRYPAYKDSGVEWIGEIPNEWKVKKLKWCLSKIESGNRESGGGNQLDDGIFSIGGEHIDWEGNLNLTNPKYISESFYDDLNSGKVMVSDILLVKDGATIGKVAFVQKLPDIKIAINEHVFLIRTNNLLYSKFLYYVLYSKIGQAQIELNVRGAAQGGLNLSFVQRLFVTIPSIELQKEVSLFLDRKIEQLNRFIHKESQFIELLKESRKAIITNAVTKGLDHSVPMKNSGVVWIGEIPEHWKLTRIKFVSEVTMGQSPSSDFYLDNGDLPFLQGCAEFGEIFPNPKHYCEVATKTSRPGDILLSVRAPVGEINLSDRVYGIGRGLCSIRPLKDKGDYLKWYLFAAKNKLISISNGSTYDAVAIGDVKNLEIPISMVEFEQNAICEYLNIETTKIELIISKHLKLIDLLKEYKASLISQAVTGKIDVRGFAVPTDSNSA